MTSRVRTDDTDVLLVERRRDSQCTVFTINRPHALNALSTRWWEEFAAAVERFNADDEMRVGILTGTGRAFSAGRDLKELASAAAEAELPSVPGTYHRELCSASPKPFICAVNGLAVGAGVERALDCDIRIAAPEAIFQLPEPRWGLVASTAVRMLPGSVALGDAMYLLLSGEAIDATTALRFGLVQEIVARESLLTRAEEIARCIGRGEPAALAATKRMAQLATHTAADSSRARVAELSDPRTRAAFADRSAAFVTRSARSDGGQR